ncbi:hypothetical protein G7Y79_00004g012530 [Physcia stellaris]|nr:hypothetical protein G7Y79_00004g012530 [Physcia stellaris]
MPKRKAATSAATAVKPVAVPLPAQTGSERQSTFRYIILVLSSFALSVAARTSSSYFVEGDLAGVTRTIDDWPQISGFLGGRAVELALAWWGKYDGVDMAALTLLSHMPYYQLLRIFYAVRPTTVINNMAIDMLSVYIPLVFLRPNSVTHDATAPKSAVSNRSIINDLTVQGLTSLLATGIYGLVLYASLVSWLPLYIVTHFDGVRSLQGAHEAAYPFVALGVVPLGFAAKAFIFTPAMGGRPDSRDARNAAFNPATASFWETIKYNVWGHSKRTRILIQRTTTLIAFTGLYTWLQTYFVVEGAEFFGAAGWSGVWALAASLTGIAFGGLVTSREYQIKV